MKTGKLVETESGLENVQDLGASSVVFLFALFDQLINEGDFYPLFIFLFFVFVFLRIINTVEIIFRS